MSPLTMEKFRKGIYVTLNCSRLRCVADYLWKELDSFQSGSECTTILCNPSGQVTLSGFLLCFAESEKEEKETWESGPASEQTGSFKGGEGMELSEREREKERERDGGGAWAALQPSHGGLEVADEEEEEQLAVEIYGPVLGMEEPPLLVKPHLSSGDKRQGAEMDRCGIHLPDRWTDLLACERNFLLGLPALLIKESFEFTSEGLLQRWFSAGSVRLWRTGSGNSDHGHQATPTEPAVAWYTPINWKRKSSKVTQSDGRLSRKSMQAMRRPQAQSKEDQWEERVFDIWQGMPNQSHLTEPKPDYILRCGAGRKRSVGLDRSRGSAVVRMLQVDSARCQEFDPDWLILK
ncbi:hypothetical protein L345_15918, partial [Ophiophagus hannah]